MKTINALVNEFKTQDENTNSERNNVLRKLIKEHGFDKVSEATGYKVSTLIAVNGNQTVLIADSKVRQAEYVFKNLNVE